MSRALFFVACSLSSMACLITREPVYEEAPNLPPSVHGSAASPMNRIQIVPASAPSGADAGPTATDVEIVAIIRDVNTRQPLEARAFVNLDPDAPRLLQGYDVPAEQASLNPLERELRFTVPVTALDQSCNRIELYVSDEFEQFGPNEPATPAPGALVGSGAWFVGVQSAPDALVDMRPCQ